MAVTSVWAVKCRMDTVLNYIENPEKTTQRPEEAPEANAAMKHIRDVLGYACNEDKTDEMMYVTGVNCDPDTALEEFIEVKQRWHKEGGRLAYHGYQSFLEGPGEITAEEAHEIGVELAKNYGVIVSRSWLRHTLIPVIIIIILSLTQFLSQTVTNFIE